MTETFYDLLGVSEDASTEAIETAYREAIKEVHPDVSDDVNASERTKRLNEAKKVLTDADERAKYDRVGHAAYTGDGPTPPGAGSADGPGSPGPTARSSGSSDAGGGSSASATGSSGAASRSGGRTRSQGADDDAASSARSERRRRRERSGAGRRHRRASGGFDDAEWPGDVGGGSRGAANSPWGEAESSTGRSSDATGPSHASTGPSWQSSGTTRAATAGNGGVEGPSARRQAAAGATDGPNVDWSWNAWERTRSWAVRQGDGTRGGLHPRTVFTGDQSAVLTASAFLLYPFFVVTVLFPPFPFVARATVAVCILLMFAYLLSVPRVAIFVYGVWSALVPLFVFLIPGVSIFSLAGIVGLGVTWIPLGLSVLALSVVRP